MLAVPPAVLDLLQLQVGSVVALDVDGGRLIVHSRKRPRYTLDDLLSQAKVEAPPAQKDREWIDLAPIGEEL